MKNLTTWWWPKPHYIFGIDDAIGIGVGAIAGMFSGGQAQKQSANMADHAMDFTRDQTQANRDFQERMRATQYQTATDDMMAAGLNPMLAYQQGGAGTPAGSSGGGTTGPVAQADLLQGATTAAQIKLIEAQADKAKSEADVNREQLPVVRGQVGMQNAQVQLLMQQAEQLNAYTALNDEQRRLVHENIKNAVKEGHQIDARTGNIQVDTVLKQLDVPKAKNEAEAQNSAYMKHVAPYTGEVGKFTNSAADLARARRGFNWR